jgi:Domain of unknown function (DUF222)
MSELLSVIDTYAATDVHALAGPALLVETELLIDARCRLDALIASHLKALEVREVTVSECGRQPAFGAGEINFEHVRVILGCLLTLSADWREVSEAELLGFAREHDPGMLAGLCRDLRVRAGADESAEAAAERRYASRYLSLKSTCEGMVHLDGMLDPESAATVTAALTELARLGLGTPTCPTTVGNALR